MRNIQRIGFLFAAALVCTAAAAAPAARAPTAKAAAPKAAPQPTPAAAPVAQPSASGPTDVQTLGDWTTRCLPVQSQSACDMAQESTNQETKRRLVAISIAYVPRENRYTTMIVVPLGVQLPSGVTVTRGAYKSKPLAFRRCEDDGCYVEATLDPAIVAELSKNGDPKATLTVTAFGGSPIALPLSLNGFTNAMTAMKRVAQEKVAVASE